MGVRFPPPAPSKLKAYQLVGFFYVYFCVYFTPYKQLSTHEGILHEYLRWNSWSALIVLTMVVQALCQKLN